jgi:hypothetical protein
LRKQTWSEATEPKGHRAKAIREERQRLEADLDRLEERKGVPTNIPPKPQPNVPSALPEHDRLQIQEIIEAQGSEHRVVDGILSSRIRRQPLKARKWTVEGFGPGMATGVVDALKNDGEQ